MNSPEPEPLPSPDNTCAVIVTYHPGAQLRSRAARIVTQLRRTIIVDNSTRREEAAQLQKMAESDPRFDLVVNSANLGIAEALNIGLERAIDGGAAWVLLLDQDTIPNDDMVTSLCRVYADYPDRERVKLVGSSYAASTQCRNQLAVEITCVITSGSLLSTAAFRQAGPFRADFFIDEVDHEYCLRLRRLGWKILLACAPTMQHDVGRSHQRLGLQVSEHSPVREYYIIRNRIALLRAYFWSEPAWCFSQTMNTVLHLAATFLLGIGDRSKNARAIALGTWHGIRGRLGPIDEQRF
jgi:rhamnosyltransferase